MRRLLPILFCSLICQCVPSAAIAQDLYKKVHTGAHCNEMYYAAITGKAFQSGMLMWIAVTDWRRLTDESFRGQVLNAAFQENLDHCRGKAGWTGAPLAAVVVRRGGSNILIAWMSAADRRWIVSFDQVQKQIDQEDAAELAMKARIAQEEARREAEKRAQETRLAAEAKAAAEKDERKQKATQDCAGGIAVSGGPWLSSTYKIAALDEAHRLLRGGHMPWAEYFCLKTIEYISPAPNPFGGNAARARFIGYDLDYRPKVQVRDFIY